MSNAMTMPRYASGGSVRRDAARVQRAGRHGDTLLAHISPASADALKRMGGSGTINPETGAQEYFKLGNIFRALAPVALSVLAPGLGSAIGAGLGLSGSLASVVGNSLIGGGIGGLTGGGKGALTGALTGGLSAAAAPILGNAFQSLSPELAQSLGVSGGADTVFGRGFGGGLGGGLTGGEGGIGSVAAGGESAYNASGGSSGGGGGTAPAPYDLSAASAPSTIPPQPSLLSVANYDAAQAGAGLGSPPVETPYDLSAASAPSSAPASTRGSGGVPSSEDSWLKRNRTALMLGGGALALSSLGAQEEPQQGSKGEAPKLPASWTEPLEKQALDRAYLMPTDAELQMFGRASGGAPTGRFYDAPNRFKKLKDGGKVDDRPDPKDEAARGEAARRAPPKVSPATERWRPFEQYDQFREPRRSWTPDEVKPNSRPSSRPQNFADGGAVGGDLKTAAKRVQKAGRKGDTILAHIMPEEADMLQRMGGAGTRNPKTGLMEFDNGEIEEMLARGTKRPNPATGTMQTDGPMVQAPSVWQSAPDHPPTMLAYITPEEAKLLSKKDLHNSGVDKERHYGPGGLPSFNGIDGGLGDGATSPGGTTGDMAGDNYGYGDPAAPGPEAANVTTPGEQLADALKDGYSPRGFGERVSDSLGRAASNAIHSAVQNPATTAINALAGLALGPVGMVNSLSGLLGGPTLGGLATSAGRAAGAALGANNVSNVSNATPGGIGQLGAGVGGADSAVSGGVSPTGYAAPSGAGSLASSASAPSASGTGDWGRTFMPNIDYANFGRGNAPTSQSTGFFYDAPNMRRMAQGGGVSGGPSDGRADDVPAKLSVGEHVVDAEAVSLLGNGNNDAGHKALEEMKATLRRAKGGALAKGKISPNAKKPLQYMKRSKAA